MHKGGLPKRLANRQHLEGKLEGDKIKVEALDILSDAQYEKQGSK